MDSFELIIFIASGVYSIIAMYKWYNRISGNWPSEKSHTTKVTLSLLPLISFVIILFTLRVLASFDVVGDVIYIMFYIVLGFAWVFIFIDLVFYFFDISWTDDALQNDNKAALFAVAGAFLGIVLIYSGANVGDGPGWWCVIFAGGLGITAWFIVSLIMNKVTQVFERITVNRDLYCGIRFGSYLLASGLILARASAGDWTSFSMTIVEFTVGWPVLLLTLLAVLVERYYISLEKSQEHVDDNYLRSSVCWGIAYIVIAIISVIMFPLVENPAYGSIAVLLSGVYL